MHKIKKFFKKYKIKCEMDEEDFSILHIVVLVIGCCVIIGFLLGLHFAGIIT